MMQKTKVAIGLGSNLGNRLEMLREAASILQKDVLEEVRSSAVYETAPWGITDQPPFLNAVLVGISEWKPAALVNYLKTLENQLGRTKTVQNGPRELDLDLLAFGETVFESEGVCVPHPGIPSRDFVLVPLLETWPDWVHPIEKVSIGKLFEKFLLQQQNSAQPFAPSLLER